MKKAKLIYQELRLGNIVHYKNRIKLHTLRVTSLDEKKLKLGGCLRRYDQVIPAPLTKEIIVDWCGFTYDENKDAYNKNGIKLRHNPETNSVFIRLCGTVRELTSLHQLQNLYFAVTGEEINVPEEFIDPWVDTWGFIKQKGEHSEEYLEFCKKYDEQQRGTDGYDLNPETDSTRDM